MRRSKTVYLDIINKWIAIIFLIQIYVCTTLGIAYLNKMWWLAISQFIMAGGLTLFLLIYYLLNYNCGNKYIHFDEAGVEFKYRYFEDKTFLHWESIRKITFMNKKILMDLKMEDQKPVVLKCPHEKFNEIKDSFLEYIEQKDIDVEES